MIRTSAVNEFGSSIFRVTSRGALDTDFINTKTESDELRRKVQGILGKLLEPDAVGLNVDAHWAFASPIPG